MPENICWKWSSRRFEQLRSFEFNGDFEKKFTRWIALVLSWRGWTILFRVNHFSWDPSPMTSSSRIKTRRQPFISSPWRTRNTCLVFRSGKEELNSRPILKLTYEESSDATSKEWDSFFTEILDRTDLFPFTVLAISIPPLGSLPFQRR